MNPVSDTQPIHLTDDQFAECAMQAPGAEAQAHLDVCSACRQELLAFQASVGDFSVAAMNWSEAQPAVSLRAAEVASKRQPLLAYAGLAVAAGLVLAVAAPMVRHHGDEPVVHVASLAPEDSAAQIDEDNRMMQTVAMAIGTSEPSPFREYQLQDVQVRRPAVRTEARSE